MSPGGASARRAGARLGPWALAGTASIESGCRSHSCSATPPSGDLSWTALSWSHRTRLDPGVTIVALLQSITNPAVFTVGDGAATGGMAPIFLAAPYMLMTPKPVSYRTGIPTVAHADIPGE